MRGARFQGNRFIDWITRRWVRATGERLNLRDHEWLDAPAAPLDGLPPDWVEQEASLTGGTVVASYGTGLLPDFTVLDSDGFKTSALKPAIVDFYQHTSRWELEVWVQWSRLFFPFGWLLMQLFGRRLQQFSLPLQPMDVSLGMESSVKQVVNENGTTVGAAWERKLVRTQQRIYSGWYGVVQLPQRESSSVRVAFPLPRGSLQVVLEPKNVDGDLELVSEGSTIGSAGTYLVVKANDSDVWVRRVPISERFKVFVDSKGTLRTDHFLDIWRFRVLHLHYKMNPIRFDR